MNDLTGSEQSQVESDIDMMYRAGRVIFPDKAKWAAEQAKTVIGALNTLNDESAKMNDRAGLEAPMQILTDIHKALERLVNTFDDCAEGLVHIADGFVKREDYAREAFKGLQNDLKHNTGVDVDDPGKTPYSDDKFDSKVAANPGKIEPKRVDAPSVNDARREDGSGGVGENPLRPGSKQEHGTSIDDVDQPEAEKDRATREGRR